MEFRADNDISISGPKRKLESDYQPKSDSDLEFQSVRSIEMNKTEIYASDDTEKENEMMKITL